MGLRDGQVGHAQADTRADFRQLGPAEGVPRRENILPVDRDAHHADGYNERSRETSAGQRRAADSGRPIGVWEAATLGAVGIWGGSSVQSICFLCIRPVVLYMYVTFFWFLFLGFAEKEWGAEGRQDVKLCFGLA